MVGVKTYTGAVYSCKVCVLCTGTYLNARCITGNVSVYTGPNGLQAATHLTDSLEKLGIEMRRLKQVHLPELMAALLIILKWSLNTVMRRLYPFFFTNTSDSVQREQVKMLSHLYE